MCVGALLALQTQWDRERREKEEEEARQRRARENNHVPSLSACVPSDFCTTATNSIPFSSCQQYYMPQPEVVQEETNMFLRNEILKIQHDEQQKVNAENTEAFKHIVECIDEDLKRFAVENPSATERVYHVQSFEFTVPENKTEYLPGELRYVKVSNLHFKALKEHYENEHFECDGTYDRSYGNGKFVISWA